MHSSLNRLQAVFSQLTSLAFALAAIIAALSLLPISSTTPPTAEISVGNVQVVRGRAHYYSTKREEYAQIRFDLKADLGPLFDWNTKQVFVYVSAEYPTPQFGLGEAGSQGSLASRQATNKAVIWDSIISAPATRWSFSSVKERWFPARKTKKLAKKATTKEVTKPGLINLRNQKAKYSITDPSGVLASRPNVTLTVSWNVQPWVGALLWDRSMLVGKNGGVDSASWNLPFLKHAWAGAMPRSASFDFPPLKGAKVEVKDDGPKTPKAAEASGIV